MKVEESPRISLNDVGLVRWLRDTAQAINATSEGRMAGSHNAQIMAPTTGTYANGDYIRNSAPARGLYQGWVWIFEDGEEGDTALWCGVTQIGALSGDTASRPDAAALGLANDLGYAGYMYLDTDLAGDGKPIWWNGFAWVDATGAIV